MKFAHISDLHLGIELSGFSLLEDQSFILTKIISIVQEQKVDGVLIAGDVFDKGIAPLEAIRLFESFLKRLSKICKNIFIISGNHDTAERLTFGREFMESSGIYFSKVYDGKIEPVVLTDEHGPVNVYLLPFVKPASVRFYNPEEKIEGFNDALDIAVKKMNINPQERNVCVAHQNIVSAQRCDSEGMIFGGLDGVAAEIFEGFDYTALGHIHGPQSLGKNKTVRFCGTPLKYSLSEKNHKKSVTIVELKEKGSVTVSAVELEPLRDVREIKGSFEEIVKAGQNAGNEKNDYISIVLTDEDEVINAFYQLRNVFPYMIQMRYDNMRTKNTKTFSQMGNIKSLNPLELFDKFYENRNGLPMKENQKEYIKKLVEEIWEGEK